jgi:uncharacterized protein
MSMHYPCIVITASDVPRSEATLNASSSLVGGTWPEGDCACPDDGFSIETVEPSALDEQIYHLADLHTDRLTEEFTLAFNPLNGREIALLSWQALALLRTFQVPRTLADGVQAAGNPIGGQKTALRLVQLGLLDQVGAERCVTRSAPRTLTAWLHVTNACDLRCPYCYVRKTAEHMELTRGRQAVDAVFRSAKANGFRRVKLKYAGGEATLNVHTLLQIHDYACALAAQHHLELEAVVLSNGVRFDEWMIDELKVRQMRLMISLDGVGENHDVQRHFASGRGSFAHVERTLDRLEAHAFTPAISITISNRNLRGLPQTVAYVLRRRLPFTLNFFRDNECAVSFADLTYQDDQIIAAMRAAFAAIETNLPFHSLLGMLVDRARLDTPHDKPCGVGQSYLVIDQNGAVAKCHMEIEQTITNIAAPDALAILREDQIGLLNPPVHEKEGCRDCTWRFWCAGGCPALTYRVTGRFDVKSPNCRIYQALFPEVLRLEGLRLLRYSQVQAG